MLPVYLPLDQFDGVSCEYEHGRVVARDLCFHVEDLGAWCVLEDLDWIEVNIWSTFITNVP